MSDYIKREDALAICQKAYEERLRMQDYCGDTVAWNIGADIKLLPAIDVTPVVRGKWIDYSEPNEDGNCQCYCSNCYAGDVQRVGEKVPYCWKCGAQMDGE